MSKKQSIKYDKITFEEETRLSIIKDLKEKSKVDDEVVNNKDLEIQSKRVLKIFDQAIKKLYILAKLPYVLQYKENILRKYLSKGLVDYIYYVCEKYQMDLFTDKREKIEYDSIKYVFDSLEEIQGKSDSDVHISKVIDIIFNSKCIVKEMNHMKGEEDKNAMKFIYYLERLRNILDERLKTSGFQERNKNVLLKNAYRDNILLTEAVKEIEEDLERQKEDLIREKDIKNKIVENILEQMTKMREKFGQDINEVVLKSERAMMTSCNASEMRQNELNNEVRETTKQYETLLAQHLEEEKNLRAKRLKIEAQLASWLAKYDNDVGERQTNLEELQDIFDKDKAEVDVIQKLFNEQSILFNQLIEEREEEERRAWEEKVMLFMYTHAQKTIAKYWKLYKERKMSKLSKKGKGKKGKKSKKGKK